MKLSASISAQFGGGSSRVARVTTHRSQPSGSNRSRVTYREFDRSGHLAWCHIEAYSHTPDSLATAGAACLSRAAAAAPAAEPDRTQDARLISWPAPRTGAECNQCQG